mgnify:FL=1
MGGSTSSTPMGNGSQLAQQFGQSTGYQQPNAVAPIGQPQIQTPILPTPEQAAAATRARMQARTPMAAPVTAPVRQNQQYLGTISRHSGDYHVGQTPTDLAKRRLENPPQW